MAIYKLEEIGNFKGGISTLNKNKYDTGMKFINYMDVFKNMSIDDSVDLRLYDADEREYKKHNVIYGDALFTASSETPEEIAISSVYLSDDMAIVNGFCKRFRFDQTLLKPKFASFLFRGNSFRKIVSTYASGYTRYNISQKDLGKITIDIPTLEQQQKIIDIIEPIEEIINTLNSLNNKIKDLERKLIIFSEKTNNEFNYNKGSQPNKETEGAKTIFLNVSAANGKPNRLVTNEPNIFIGDVTLSLDGNCGLVNNALEGFNGYLYKVFSDKFDSWQVYYSLLTRESQEIIKMNETGTTIMHAPGAKKDLRLFEFKYSELLENFFKLRTIHKLCFDKLNEQRDKLIELLVK